ncbi:MAG: type II toxin-antitoxin system VapC family toxin [Rhizomicrobium sp.]
MTSYLLDTNIVSDLVRHPRGTVRNRIAEKRGGHIGTSIIVAAELRYGAGRKKSSGLASQLEEVLAGLEIFALAEPTDVYYARLRAQLEKAGKTIGGNDMFIAAHALALGCTLVTDNVREFSRVKALTVENWLR